MAVAALVANLQRHGIGFLDAGMVTNFTAGLTGRYIDRAEFEELQSTLPREPIDFQWQQEMPEAIVGQN